MKKIVPFHPEIVMRREIRKKLKQQRQGFLSYSQCKNTGNCEVFALHPNARIRNISNCKAFCVTHNAIKTKCTTFQNIDQVMVWVQFCHHILCMIFQKKCFSCYIILADQCPLSDCFYFLRYWAICVLKLFDSQSLMSRILKLT